MLFTKTHGKAMRLTILFTFLAMLQVHATGIAQQTITYSGRGVALQKVFSVIKKQTGYKFFYDDADLRESKPVTIDLNKASLESALEKILADQPVQYKIEGKTIVITKKMMAPATNLNAPPIDVRGRVVDERGHPLAGVNVVISGTKRGTITDDDGRFSLQAEEGAVLEISSIGFGKKLVSVRGAEELVVALDITSSVLDEVQYIAYGQTSKRFSVGNVGTVKAADIEKQPVVNPLLALQGRVPGLFITQSTGFTGSGVTVRIEGQNSILKGNDPLYVIDGVPYNAQLLTSLNLILGSSGGGAPDVANVAGNPLTYINPMDIESIDVLKDADATAIYGSRAANGAILITTKKGKIGRTRVDINMQTGWGKVTRSLDLMNTPQYLDMRKEALENENISISPTDVNYDVNGFWDATRYTDWQKELLGHTARYTDIQAGVSGGNANTQFLLGTGYHKETTVFPGNMADERGSFHFNFGNVSNNQKFRVQLSSNYLVDDNRLINRDITQDAVALAPNAPALYNEDGSLNWAQLPTGNSTWTNPLAYLNNEYTKKTYNLIANLVVSYRLLKGLEVKANAGYTNMQSNEVLIFPSSAIRPELRPQTTRTSQFSHSLATSWIVEPQVSYEMQQGKWRFSALAGTTLQQNDRTQEFLSGSGYINDQQLKNISAAPEQNASSVSANYNYTALFSRFTFTYADKYILNVTGRRDGSSRFGSENQFHNFGSIGAGWIFSNENIFQHNVEWISFGKLRASYGTTGSDQIGDYQYLNLYNPITDIDVPYQHTTGLEPDGLPNNYLQWEETRKLQFGLDLGLLQDRVLFNVNYYHHRSSNQLLSYTLPVMTGFTQIARNFPALVQNTGWELTVNTTNLAKKNLVWKSSLNLTISRNKLVAFEDLATSSYAASLVVGEPITITKLFHLAGVDPVNGMYAFFDKEGNKINSPSFETDQTAIVNTLPKYYGGFQNSLLWKNFTLDVLFQFVKQMGRTIFPGNSLPGHFSGVGNIGNQTTDFLDRWQKAGEVTAIQKFGLRSNSDLLLSYLYAQRSDASFMDASYIRLKNISLSWQLPDQWKQKVSLQNARVYVQGQNILTITNYKGLDPETISSGTLPPLRVITIGLQVGL